MNLTVQCDIAWIVVLAWAIVQSDVWILVYCHLQCGLDCSDVW